MIRRSILIRRVTATATRLSSLLLIRPPPRLYQLMCFETVSSPISTQRRFATHNFNANASGPRHHQNHQRGSSSGQQHGRHRHQNNSNIGRQAGDANRNLPSSKPAPQHRQQQRKPHFGSTRIVSSEKPLPAPAQSPSSQSSSDSSCASVLPEGGGANTILLAAKDDALHGAIDSIFDAAFDAQTKASSGGSSINNPLQNGIPLSQVAGKIPDEILEEMEESLKSFLERYPKRYHIQKSSAGVMTLFLQRMKQQYSKQERDFPVSFGQQQPPSSPARGSTNSGGRGAKTFNIVAPPPPPPPSSSPSTLPLPLADISVYTPLTAAGDETGFMRTTDLLRASNTNASEEQQMRARQTMVLTDFSHCFDWEYEHSPFPHPQQTEVSTKFSTAVLMALKGGAGVGPAGGSLVASASTPIEGQREMGRAAPRSSPSTVMSFEAEERARQVESSEKYLNGLFNVDAVVPGVGSSVHVAKAAVEEGRFENVKIALPPMRRRYPPLQNPPAVGAPIRNLFRHFEQFELRFVSMCTTANSPSSSSSASSVLKSEGGREEDDGAPPHNDGRFHMSELKKLRRFDLNVDCCHSEAILLPFLRSHEMRDDTISTGRTCMKTPSSAASAVNINNTSETSSIFDFVAVPKAWRSQFDEFNDNCRRAQQKQQLSFSSSPTVGGVGHSKAYIDAINDWEAELSPLDAAEPSDWGAASTNAASSNDKSNVDTAPIFGVSILYTADILRMISGGVGTGDKEARGVGEGGDLRDYTLYVSVRPCYHEYLDLYLSERERRESATAMASKCAGGSKGENFSLPSASLPESTLVNVNSSAKSEQQQQQQPLSPPPPYHVEDYECFRLARFMSADVGENGTGVFTPIAELVANSAGVTQCDVLHVLLSAPSLFELQFANARNSPSYPPSSTETSTTAATAGQSVSHGSSRIRKDILVGVRFKVSPFFIPSLLLAVTRRFSIADLEQCLALTTAERNKCTQGKRPVFRSHMRMLTRVIGIRTSGSVSRGGASEGVSSASSSSSSCLLLPTADPRVQAYLTYDCLPDYPVAVADILPKVLSQSPELRRLSSQSCVSDTRILRRFPNLFHIWERHNTWVVLRADQPLPDDAVTQAANLSADEILLYMRVVVEGCIARQQAAAMIPIFEYFPEIPRDDLLHCTHVGSVTRSMPKFVSVALRKYGGAQKFLESHPTVFRIISKSCPSKSTEDAVFNASLIWMTDSGASSSRDFDF